MVDPRDLTQLMELALKLNAPTIVRQLSVGELRREVSFKDLGKNCKSC